ncbi:uroporphyrinogen-III synthase [Ramlibacter sp. MMS24-I3-19]|uniref:uroporphyrinogen-III synthase n=1 Tax=Ramlibacter sp. MMS24-I3-19 TaxID=3416606 RepID=UPI003D07B035
MRVVLTRPAADAARWSSELVRRGHQVLALPLIDIGPLADMTPVRTAWTNLPKIQAAMFVSANAVRHFMAAAGGTAWPAGTQAWATGPGTVAALHEARVPAAQIVAPRADAPQFDSEALWHEAAARVKPQWRVLIVRGAGSDGATGREWLAQQLQQAGAQVEQLAVYERRRPTWTEAQRASARDAAADGSVWLFSSSEAIANLRALAPGVGWARARALATHERIARAAREAGFGDVMQVRATLDAVVRTLESSR